MFVVFVVLPFLTASLLSVFTLAGAAAANGTFNPIDMMEKFDKVRLNEKNYGLVRNLHMNWYASGIKALMGKMGRDMFIKLMPNEQNALAACLDGIEDKRDLVQSAKCLTNSRRIYHARLVESALAEKVQRAKKRETDKGIGKDELMEWKKRLAQKWKSKMGREIAEKGKKRSKWTVERPSLEEKFLVRQADSLEKLAAKNDRSAIIRVSNLISKLTNGNKSSTDNGVKWTKMFSALVRLKRINEKRKSSPGAAVYEKRMFDLVLDRKEPSLGPKSKLSPEGILRQGFSLLQMLHNGTDPQQIESTNYKVMSPRFAPLMPDQTNGTQSILSPTVFALYETVEEHYGGNKNNSRNKPTGDTVRRQGRKEPLAEIASIPQILKATGLSEKDRAALLQALMEVSGTVGHVQQAMELLSALNFFEIEPDIRTANDRILAAYTKMEKSFGRAQRTELEKEGWTFIRRTQFDQLTRDQFAEFPADLTAKMSDFEGLNKNMREEAVWKRIERIAKNIPEDIADKLDKRRREKSVRLHLSDESRRRLKRQPQPSGGGGPQINWISVLKPVVLEPYMFTPTYGLSVLGPLILSPNIFSPAILAPSVLSPWVLSPAAPVPFILSPYVFGPFILSPMAMAPFILTPYVLSPNVLNPFALSPLILSPTVLSPDILSPQILGGGILSPTVGSPAVLTESALMASVLSPSVLS